MPVMATDFNAWMLRANEGDGAFAIACAVVQLANEVDGGLLRIGNALTSGLGSDKEDAQGGTLAEATAGIANAINRLGHGTNMDPGALEAISMSLTEGAEKIAVALGERNDPP